MVKEKFDFSNNSSKEVLNKIRLHEEISSAELSRITSYQPSTISNIIKRLKNRGVIEVSRISSGDSVGKPPTLWKISEEEGYIIGIECLPNEIRSRIVDISGNILSQKRRKYNKCIKDGEIAEKINEYIKNILNEFKYIKNDILGLGIALPGLIDGENGVIHYSREFEISEYDLREKIEQEFSIPIYLANDANAGALGEIWFKHNKDYDNLVFLTVNEITKDLGSGIIIDNQLYTGISGTAGELLTSLPNVIKLISEIKEENNISSNYWDRFSRHEEVSFSEIVKKSRQNDPVASIIIEKFSEVIATQIVNLIGIINPDLIVLGGDISTADYIVKEYILPRVKQHFEKYFPEGVAFPEITTSEYGLYSVSMGAISLILKDIFLLEQT